MSVEAAELADMAVDMASHPDRPITQLRRIPLRRTSCHDSNLPNS